MKPARTAILLANAGETPDPAAARTACDLARRGGARLFVVHVARPQGPATGEALPSKLPAYAVLAALVAQCASAGGLVTRANLRLGAADEEILAEAEEAEAGLIVVAGRRCAPAQPPPAGELGERVARRAACPVLIVRDDEPGNSRARLTIAGSGATGPRQAGQYRAAAR